MHMMKKHWLDSDWKWDWSHYLAEISWYCKANDLKFAKFFFQK